MNGIRYELPDIKRAIILSPHPDDETLGCGGTIALYSKEVDFTVIALSDGEAVNLPEEDKAELRRRELNDAMEILGVRDIILLHLPDGQFQRHRDEIKKRLSELFMLKKPQMVFSPSPFDLHSDHRETAMACIELIEEFPAIRIAFYEVYSPVRFNTLIDIGRVIELKREAIGKYHYSLLKKSGLFISSSLSLNKFRSFFTLRDSFYEAFWIPEAVQDIAGITEWFTYNAALPSPEERLLSRIKAADALLYCIREYEREMEAEKDRMTYEARRNDEVISELRGQIVLMERSIFWRLAARFHGIKDRALPEGSQRRALYEKIINALRDRR